MRISDWSSDVCFSDLLRAGDGAAVPALAVVPDQDGLAQRNAAGFFAQVRASVCLVRACLGLVGRGEQPLAARFLLRFVGVGGLHVRFPFWLGKHICRSEEHTSELQSLMRISYAVFCLKKKNNINIEV